MSGRWVPPPEGDTSSLLDDVSSISGDVNESLSGSIVFSGSEEHLAQKEGVTHTNAEKQRFESLPDEDVQLWSTKTVEQMRELELDTRYGGVVHIFSGCCWYWGLVLACVGHELPGHMPHMRCVVILALYRSKAEDKKEELRLLVGYAIV